MMREKYNPIAKAATDTIKQTGEQIKSEARAAIAAGGFSVRWQNAFRVEYYPSRGYSANAALFAHHRIKYAGVFAHGAVIRPRDRSLLWIPLPNTAVRIGRRTAMTPENLEKAGIPLHYYRSVNGRPMLATYVWRGRAGSRITVAKMRRGQAGGSGVVSVPLFVGVPFAQIAPRFRIDPIFRKAKDGLAAKYFENWRKEN